MTQIFINNVVVDIEKEMAMSLNFAIADILEPDKRNTNFSKTLKLPGTKVNNKLFGHIFEIAKEINSTDTFQNFTVDFNPNLKASCKIFQENLLQFNGIVQLLQVNRLNQRYEYEVVVYGALRNLMTSFESLKLEDIDLSKYDHTFNRTNIVDSWDTKIQKDGADYVNFILGQPTGEGYVYPIIDYGYTQSGLRIRMDKLYLSVYVREYFLNMFTNTGFTWTSDFLDGDFFRHLIIPFSKAQVVLTDTDIVNRSFKASTSIQRVFLPPTGAITIIDSQRLIFDNDSTGGNFDTTNQFDNGLGPISNPAFTAINDTSTVGKFTVFKKGNYNLLFDINILLEFFNVGSFVPKSDYGRITFVLVRKNSSGVVKPLSGVASILGSGDIEGLATSLLFSSIISLSNTSLNRNDTVEIQIRITRPNATVGDTDSRVTVSMNNFYSATALSIPILIGDTMAVNACIPKDILQKDFFTSIIKMFNLYVQPDPDNDANLLIEPLIDFYDGNSLVDWTSYVDYNKEILIKPISAIEGKDYIFKYKDDTDFYNADYKSLYGKSYGEKNLSIDNDFLKGKKVTELIFSPTPSWGAIQNEMVIPRIIKENENGSVAPFQSNIRILYYGGVLPVVGSFNFVASNGTTILFTETNYAYAGHLDHPFFPTLDLLFAIPKTIYWGGPTNIGLNYTNNNLYNKYYDQFIDEITDRNSKIVTLSVRLRPIDVFKLDFKNFIHIDGINYRLNRVIDYSPTNEGICKIEVSKIKRGFTFVPFNDEITDGTAQDPTNFDLVEGGKNEVRSASAISFVTLIDGSINSVIGISGLSVPLLNGGKN